ncbi:DUF1801 domain-containing protein [Lentzea sp. NPDC051208]|uniref:DUF1801 domain-containing protein n=1 Tax=Lentzea sp. NPDC051208 TaxID=3154642 RepID=UPI00341AAFBE
MVQSQASTVAQYLAELPDEQRAEVEAVRDVILANLPGGYVEAMDWGLITYGVPLEVSGPTYNKKPLLHVALGAQKRYCSVYLTTVMEGVRGVVPRPVGGFWQEARHGQGLRALQAGLRSGPGRRRRRGGAPAGDRVRRPARREQG